MTRPAPIASTRHTVTLLAVFVGVAAVTAFNMRGGSVSHTPASKVPLYLGAIVFEWLLLWGTLRGLNKPARELLGEGPLWRSILLGALAWPLVVGIGMGAKWALAHFGLDVDAASARTVARVGPHGALEIVLWILVSLSAGICEEFVFRGFLMRQFAAWLGGWPQGLAVSALVFGLGHAYQGIGPVLVIVVHGVSFGLIALVTRRLVPGMTAHAIEDIVAGLT